MPKIKYQDFTFRPATLTIIEQANTIIAEYAAQGFELTLRQLYYQFVARDIINNTERDYKRLGSIVNDGRLAGLIDWDAINDRTRYLRSNSHWGRPSEIIDSAARSFALDKWKDQDYRIEVWIEKDALVGVIEGVCSRLDVPFLSCRGYTSQSEMWAGAMRLLAYSRRHKQKVAILHLGDHDPSGIDMSRDIESRMELFMGGVKFERLALNMDQVEAHNPPPNPAKVTDSRFESYRAVHGDESWELDALEPRVISELVETAILALRDEDKWNAAVEREDAHRETLTWTAENWEAVERLKVENE